jgi:hypothetical protein
VFWQGTTYKGFQGAEQLCHTIEAAGAQKFVFSKTSTDGEVFQPQQVDVWMVRIVTLRMRKAFVSFRRQPIV